MFESTFCHIMRNILNLSVKKLFNFFLILFVVACGGGGGGGNSVEPQSNNPISPYASSQATQDTVQNQTQYVSGKVIDDYISGATVFIDTNGNETLDEDEPSTISDNFGNYSLPFAVGRLISIGGIDIGTQQPVDGLSLSAPMEEYTETKMITPVTSLLATEAEEAEIKEALGIPEYLDLNTADPIVEREREGGDNTLYEVGNQITVMALSLQEVVETQSSSEESTLNIIEKLSEEIKEKKKESPTGQVSLESTEIVDNLIDDVLTEANIEIEEDKLSNVVNAVANLVSTISADQDDETTKAVLSFGVTTFLSDVVEIVEGTASDEKIDSYKAETIVETLSATLSIDASRLKVNEAPILSQDLGSQIPDSGLAIGGSDDINMSTSNNDDLQASVEIVIQASGDEITAEDIEDTDLASANENENVNEVIAELVENSPPEPEPLSLAEQMVADYEAQQAEITAEDAAAQAAAEAAPPKVANVYLWYSKDSQAHFGEGEAGKSAMDTRAAYMFEVINEMYVNQRIKLEWNIVGSDFWDAPLSEDSLNYGFFPLYYSNGCSNYEEFVFETDECNEARNQRRAANDAAEADWHMVLVTALENNSPKAPVTGVAGLKKDWDSDTNFLQTWQGINVLSGFSTGNTPEEQENMVPGSMAPEIEPVLWYDYIETLWHEIGHTMCASHNRPENGNTSPKGSLCAGVNFEDIGKDTLMNGGGSMKVPPDQVISQSHPSTTIMESSATKTCVPNDALNSEPIVCQKPPVDGNGDGNIYDSSVDSGGEIARDLFNEWSYYYANLWEHKEAQLAGEVAGNNQVDMDRYDSSATSPAVTSRMLFPLIDGGEYTFTNGQRTKKMLVIEDDPVTINGTSYQEFRFVEDLGKEYCGYISYAKYCSTRQEICDNFDDNRHPTKHNCPVGALGHGDVIEGEEPRWAGFYDPSQTVFRFRISPEGHYFLSAYDDNKDWPASDGSNLRPIYQGGPALRYDLDSSLGCPFLSANFSPGHYQEFDCSFKGFEYLVDKWNGVAGGYLAVHTFKGKDPTEYAKESLPYNLPAFSGVEKRYQAVSTPYGDFITFMLVQQQYSNDSKESASYFNKFYLHPEVGIAQFEHHGEVWQLVSVDTDGDGMDNNFVGEDDDDNDGVSDQFDSAPLDPLVQ